MRKIGQLLNEKVSAKHKSGRLHPRSSSEAILIQSLIQLIWSTWHDLAARSLAITAAYKILIERALHTSKKSFLLNVSM